MSEDLKQNTIELLFELKEKYRKQVEELTEREAKLAKVLNRTKEIFDRHGVIYKSSETYEHIKNTLSELNLGE